MSSSLPLSGVRVLDLSRLLPGPFATLVLADLGADVVKVEDPGGGDYLRWMPPLAGAQSGWFHALNRNKRSLALDLAAEGGAAALLELARTFDVVVESFRPGVLDRLGCGWEALRAANPRVILCSITGYGQTGPYRDLAGHDLDYCAVAGVLARNGPAEGPLPLGVPVADLAGGAWPAVAGVLAALVRRAATGEGARVDVSMTEGALALLALAHGGAAAGEPLGRGQGSLDGRRANYGVYRTADGRFVALAALEPRFFERFCAAVGRPELAAAQIEGEGLRAELEAIFAGRTRAEWAAFGRAHDVCLAPVLEPAEAREDPQLVARGAFVEVETPWEGRALPGVATPVRLEGAVPPLRPAPRLGEGGDEVLREAGFTPDQVERLRASGALAPGSA
ncbi:MAG TPA: CaiB/BaiF CoA-transferase family protein [Anaeromyxobacteraceae bacterium]|jgi:crotonobetainyl-CoA:carnitine CoA-transferase CaiB-like acyl-CoA transferase|nr:CaiB/BaiF CoA-transferase family protein [Anaeromyxobacteraceae bacterium]